MVLGHDIRRMPFRHEASLTKEEAATTEPFDGGRIVADQEYGAASLDHGFHPGQALRLEGMVSHGKDFIDDENVGLEMRSHGEREPKIHACRIVLHRRIDELPDFCKRHNLIKPFRNMSAVHTENRAIEVDVFPTRQFLVKTCANLQ